MSNHALIRFLQLEYCEWMHNWICLAVQLPKRAAAKLSVEEVELHLHAKAQRKYGKRHRTDEKEL